VRQQWSLSGWLSWDQCSFPLRSQTNRCWSIRRDTRKRKVHGGGNGEFEEGASRSRARKQEEGEGKEGKAAARSLHTRSAAGLDNLFETKKSLAYN
jgi:hypothetical protein